MRLSTKAQSILELAIFGSIILFLLGVLISYGLGANFEQHLQMQTFRKALFEALKRAHSSINVNLNVIKDLSIPDVNSPFDISETSPYSANIALSWSNDLYAGLDDLDERDLPRIDYIINGVRKTYKIANYKYKIVPVSTEDGESVVKFKRKQTDFEDKYLINGTEGSDGIYWYWEEVDAQVVGENDSLDVDNDKKEETVIKVIKGEITDKDGTTRTVTTGLWYLDFQEGEIDLTSETPGGLQYYKYTKEIEINPQDTYLEKNETAQGIITTAISKIKEKISRLIKTKKGDEEVVSEIEREEGVSWSTPH
ncbi:MAG: hypothetical protein NC900_05525 [Candidatus Omnitrophica bacterium]|nr:hypothetical protein [Candidatus Omnitrophota bacterium]